MLAALDEKSDRLQLADELLDKVIDHLGLLCIPEPPDSANLCGALAVLEDDRIYFNNSQSGWFRNYCIAHEVAHLRLHHPSVHCSQSDIEDFSGDEESVRIAEAAVGYGAGERREREANMFALELLLPAGSLRDAFVKQELTARQIAEIVEMPVDVIAGQLTRAILVPSPVENVGDEPVKRVKLDQSQIAAAESGECPLLVSAGPGTGKTQTLTGRISYLINKGTDPQKVLALTFSNKAAEEMRQRVEVDHPDAAARMQITTFHAFALHILRKYWKEAGLDPDSRLLDRIDAVLHLERHLVEIDLNHYQQLHEPTMNLNAILSAISRAKDELCGPDEYAELAAKMLNEAADEEVRLKAEKALETARVYKFYQKYLDEEKILDFGDLLFRAVRLLRNNTVVKREMQDRYDAILVDEFQDVNRACGVLLKEVAGDGGSLWAVGDLRQSIYRWRGASSANIKLFDSDFPNAAARSLQINYRTREEITGLFAHFAKSMKAGGAEVFHQWEAKRGRSEYGAGAPVTFEIAPSITAEARNIAGRIREHHSRGIAYKDNAVICRTHNQLKQFAEMLEIEGIPIFYLGDIFEREEIRDFLALLDLRHSLSGFSLVRVSRFPEYDIPLEDVRQVITAMAADQTSFEKTAAAVIENGGLSVMGKLGLQKLLDHLSAIPADAGAWGFVVEYLFNVSAFLRPFLDKPDVYKQSRMLAVYQFIRFAENTEQRFAGPDRIPEFLGHVRTLAWFGEDRNYAQIPAAAENLDAVRLLTVHSAKGLEFPVVFLPYLGAGQFPNGRQAQTCPNPKGLVRLGGDYHAEEEECLFFVAMSRARDYLHFSRAARYGRVAKESEFLTVLSDVLPPAKMLEFEEETGGTERHAALSDVEGMRLFYSGELNAYLKCPRKYYYSNVLGLGSEDNKSAYLRYHNCVHETIGSLEAIARRKHIQLDEKTALAQLGEYWKAAEIDSHPYAPIYKRSAEQIVCRALQQITGSAGTVESPTYEIGLNNGVVRVRPHSVESLDLNGVKKIIIRNYKTGKVPKDLKLEDSEVLAVHAATLKHPDSEVVFQRFYPSAAEAVELSITDRVIKNRLEKCERAITDIVIGQFPPKADEKSCPHCAYFFICPSGD